MTPIHALFPLRGAPRSPHVPRQRLRTLLAALRDRAVRMLRGKARPDVVADAVHAAARMALQHAAPEYPPRGRDHHEVARDRTRRAGIEADMEAFAGALARAGLRLAKGRVRVRQGSRRG